MWMADDGTMIRVQSHSPDILLSSENHSICILMQGLGGQRLVLLRNDGRPRDMQLSSVGESSSESRCTVRLL